MKYESSRAPRVIVLISLLLLSGVLLPAIVRASVLGTILASIKGNAGGQHNAAEDFGNLQTMPLLKPAMNIDPAASRGGGDITIVDSSALMPEEGPSGTIADIERPKNGTISTYVVREGDTVSGIAKLFKVSPSTIIWANDLGKNQALKVGDTLTILPVTGLKYAIKKGDTLAAIAKKTGGDASEIASFNGIEDGALVAGEEITVPNGEVAANPLASSGPSAKSAEESARTGLWGTGAQIGYYLRPIAGGVRTQGIHGFNAVDLAAPIGTPILASAAGDVIVAKEGGWNAGYGNYVVIEHSNGSETLYAHQSRVIVAQGEHVVQGQVIGYVGETGHATGPHVHFEIRNGIRNPF